MCKRMSSETLEAQKGLLETCGPLLQGDGAFNSRVHALFLQKMLRPLPAGFKALDASQPWLIFWCINGLALLGEDISVYSSAVAATILSFQNESGGFGGGYGQASHLATTYAAVMALALTNNEDTWRQIDREKMRQFMLRMKLSNGSFRVCEHGEADPRASYCALSVATLLGFGDDEELTKNTALFLRDCQTYEGGFANTPLGEAHGGYAFCSVASLYFLGELEHIRNPEQLLRWLVARQDQEVPGFTGRTNKLVDGCYSHWVGGCWALLENALDFKSFWNREGLERYICCCCQCSKGGLRDKPGAHPDAYHTNYVLCGLSHALYEYTAHGGCFKWEAVPLEDTCGIKPMNPLFGLPLGVAEKMNAYFNDQ